jgi:hypothetical protein
LQDRTSKVSKRIGYVDKIIWQAQKKFKLILFPFKRSIVSGFSLNVQSAFDALFGFCIYLLFQVDVK